MSTSPDQPQPTPAPSSFGSGSFLRGTVKQVLSGDTVVVRGVPKGGPPPERTIGLSGVTAPRLARRPVDNNVSNENKDFKDEPYAWEAREFLRKKLVGKEVCFVIDPKTMGGKKEYGNVYVGKDTNGENIIESLVAEGFVELRRGAPRNDDHFNRLQQLEENAKSSKKGRWNLEEASNHVRHIVWTLENPRSFVESNKNKEIDAVVEHVRDGCTVRVFLLPSFQYVTLMFTGIKTPMFKMEEGKNVGEPFAEEAKYFTEVRILQREVKVLLEGTSNQSLLATVKHPNGNISELLLLEGFAHCSDWSMKNVSTGIDKMRAAERQAKEKKLRIWKDYKATTPAVEVKEKNLSGKVVEIVNGDALVMRMGDGSLKKIFLSSIRPPRLQDTQNVDQEGKKPETKPRTRPLYDVPYMFEAREFLRKKLIGKKISVEVDYIQPKSADFPEKTCCTVLVGGVNLAEALVSKGLATVVRYKQNDDQRSSCYDELLKAEDRAISKGVGIHSKKEAPVVRVADLAGDLQKAKHFLSFLQRAGKSEALVEFVASGSRFRLYIPKETCLITFLLAGIECPKGARPSGPGGQSMIPSEPFGEEALNYVKDHILQREVSVEIEGQDKGGNFIGWCFVDGTNLSQSLVQEGLAKVHFTAERSSYFKNLQDAERKAKEKKLNLWSLEEEKKEEVVEEVVLERKVNYKEIIVSEVTEALQFYAQDVKQGPALEKMMSEIRKEFKTSPPVLGSYTPRKGDLCAAQFSDNQWYRAQVERVAGEKYSVVYVDYGNKETLGKTRLAQLPDSFKSLSHQAHLYALACVHLPKDPDDVHNAIKEFSQEVAGKQFLLNTEYKSGGIDHVTLIDKDNKDYDVAHVLISDGILLAERKKEKYLKELSEKYKKGQDQAMKDRLNIWKYGDFTGED